MEVAKAEKSKGQGEHGVKTAETRGSPATGESSVCVYLCVCVLRTHVRSLFWLDKEQGIAAAWLYWVGMRGLPWCRESTGYCLWWTGKEKFPGSQSLPELASLKTQKHRYFIRGKFRCWSIIQPKTHLHLVP